MEPGIFFEPGEGIPVNARGYLLKPEFERFCKCKTPRSESRVASNPAEFIEAVTKTTLSTANERLRIEVLLLLSGVRWPAASVILHFCHAEPYPILDVRALGSLGIDASTVPYNFGSWWEYTSFCRELAAEAGRGKSILRMNVRTCGSWTGHDGNIRKTGKAEILFETCMS